MRLRSGWLVVSLVAVLGCGGSKSAEKKDAKPTDDKGGGAAAKPAEPEAPEHCKKALAGLDAKIVEDVKGQLAGFADADARYKRFEKGFLAACMPVTAESLACATPEGSMTCAPLADLVSAGTRKANWVDAEAAAAQTPEQRCQGLLDVMAVAMKADMAKMGQPQQDAFKKHVQDGCVALKPEDLACAEKGAKFDDCTPFVELLKTSMTQPDVMDPKELEAMKLKAMQSEPQAMLKAIGTVVAKVYTDKKGKLPASLGPTPPADCCKQPDGVCPAAGSGWDAKNWKELGYAATDPTRYHYSVQVKGKAKKTTVTIRAEGDPTCKGTKDVWVSEGALGADGALKFEDPKPGT